MESKRRFGDRKDGRLIQSLAPFYKFMPYIMPTKNDACNQFEDCIEITNTDRWLRQKRLEGYKGLGYLHLFIAAYIRMVLPPAPASTASWPAGASMHATTSRSC